VVLIKSGGDGEFEEGGSTVGHGGEASAQYDGESAGRLDNMGKGG